MIEWLILVVLVPAVVVPVVMLAGFAGCDVVFGLDRPPVDPVPAITETAGPSVSSIELKVSYTPEVQGFEFERKQLPEGTLHTLTVDASMTDRFTRLDATTYLLVDREGLAAARSYLYRVRAIDIDGEYSNWSALEPNIAATTPDYRTAFEWTLDEKNASRDAMGWASFSFVQRIEPVRLAAGGENIRLTLRASSSGTAAIERVYVSRLASGAGSDPFDAADDLTAVSVTPFVIPRNESALLTAQYRLDQTQTLLVAIDFGAAPTDIRATDPVAVTDTVGYQKPTSADQAQLQDRTGFTELAGIRLVEKIEVG